MTLTPLPDWVDSLPLPPKVAAKRRQQIEDAAEKAHAVARERCQSVREAARPRRLCRACWRSKAWGAFPADANGQRTGRVCRRCVRLAHEKESSE